MKALLVFIFYLCISSGAVAQPSSDHDNLSVVVNKPIIFNYADASELVQDKTIQNAFEIQVTSHKNCNVYANVSVSNPASQDIIKQLGLRFNNKNSPDATISSISEIPASLSSQLLFTQPKMHPNIGYYSFYYDIILHPMNTFTSPSTYNFSIVFTMTQL